MNKNVIDFNDIMNEFNDEVQNFLHLVLYSKDLFNNNKDWGYASQTLSLGLVARVIPFMYRSEVHRNKSFMKWLRKNHCTDQTTFNVPTKLHFDHVLLHFSVIFIVK